jgi:hypothetical protein
MQALPLLNQAATIRDEMAARRVSVPLSSSPINGE